MDNLRIISYGLFYLLATVVAIVVVLFFIWVAGYVIGASFYSGKLASIDRWVKGNKLKEHPDERS